MSLLVGSPKSGPTDKLFQLISCLLRARLPSAFGLGQDGSCRKDLDCAFLTRTAFLPFSDVFM